MKLEQSDAELFYQLWFPLLDFVNRKYHVCPETETIDQRQGVDTRNAKKIADYLWSHIEVIEKYLAAAELPNEYAQTTQIGQIYSGTASKKRVRCSSQWKMGRFIW